MVLRNTAHSTANEYFRELMPKYQKGLGVKNLPDALILSQTMFGKN
jgi:hypothetical protein